MKVGSLRKVYSPHAQELREICFADTERKAGNVWYFAEAGLDFSSGAPVVLTDHVMLSAKGTTVISDRNGVLLFYTDGFEVWDRDHTPMPDGSD